MDSFCAPLFSHAHFLDYVEDIYIMVLSVLVSTLNLNHMYLPPLLTVYCIALYTFKLCTTILPLSVPCVPTWRFRLVQYILLTHCHEEVLYSQPLIPSKRLYVPRSPGGLWSVLYCSSITSTSIPPKIPLSDTSVPRCNITNYIYTTWKSLLVTPIRS